MTRTTMACCSLLAVAALAAVGCGDDETGGTTTTTTGAGAGAAGAGGNVGGTGGAGAGGGQPGGFVFATDPPSAYARVDRAGMPVVAAAVITDKDGYNLDDPVDDATGKWAAEITSNVEALHTALDDDLAGAMLVPCATTDCVAAAAPLVIPDTLAIDTTTMAGFPNGRMPSDPVVDITLAIVLLDLGSHAIDTFVAIPLNPDANDVPFLAGFPYLAAPHR
jgi:Domain of unknown function (DUF4331)